MASKKDGMELNIPTLIGGALTLTAALAWNEAAKTGIQSLYPQPTKDSFRAALAYAVIVTILIIVVFAGLRMASRAAARHAAPIWDNQKTFGSSEQRQV